MSSLTSKEREAVAIAAAIGTGCRPCTQYHVRAGLKADLSEDQVRQVICEAEALRIHAATGVADFARRLLGGGEESDVPVCYPSEPLQALAQVGAAAGGNAGHILDWLLPQARGLGLSNEALTEGVELAAMVKKMAAEFFRKDAERALENGAVVAGVAGDGSCLQVPGASESCAGAPGAEAAQPAPAKCC